MKQGSCNDFSFQRCFARKLDEIFLNDAPTDAHGQFAYRWTLVHIRHSKRAAEGSVDLEQRFDNKQGVSANLKEIIRRPDLVDAQNLRPNFRKPALRLGARFKILAKLIASGRRGGQCAAVELTVGGEWQLPQHHPGRWHHVIGQPGPKKFAKLRNELLPEAVLQGVVGIGAPRPQGTLRQ